MRSLLLLITITLFQGYSCAHRYIPHHDDCNQPGELRLDNQITMNTTAGAVQVCTAWESRGQQWRYISAGYWTNTTAKKACQQLGLGYSSVTLLAVFLRDVTDNRQLEDCCCIEQANQVSDCLTRETYALDLVAYLNCGDDCKENSIRLINGPSSRNGIVEICRSNQWRRVCSQVAALNENAEVVCRQLGYPVNGATGRNENRNVVTRERSVFTECYFCDGNELFFSECLRGGNQYWTFRVGCRSHEQVVRDNGTLSTDNGGSCSTNVCNCETDCQPEPATITMDTTNEQEQLSTDQSTGRQHESDTISPWAITGVLAVVLQATIIGWIVQCICLYKKQRKGHPDQTQSSRDEQSLNNPVYDVSTTVPHTTYSSHGSSYEVIDTNEGAGHNYDVTSHRGANRPHPPTTPPVSNEEYSTLDTSRENHYHTLESNTGDGRYSMVGHTDPQDYEVPAPPPQGEEYSTLKH